MVLTMCGYESFPQREKKIYHPKDVHTRYESEEKTTKTKGLVILILKDNWYNI